MAHGTNNQVAANDWGMLQTVALDATRRLFLLV